MAPNDLFVETSAPQVIRIGGLAEVMSRLDEAALEDATCDFSAGQTRSERKDDNDVCCDDGGEEGEGEDGQCSKDIVKVPCYCDTSMGTMECQVPIGRSTRVGSNGLRLRAKIGDTYESPFVGVHYIADIEGKSESAKQQDEANVIQATSNNTDAKTHDPATSLNWHLRLLNALSRQRIRLSFRSRKLFYKLVAEAIGTMLIVIFGVGSVCNAVLTGYNAGGLWPVAVVWGFGVSLAIASTRTVSDAHLNPAVSLAFAIFRPHDFPWRNLIPYWCAQYLGGVIGGAFNLMVYGAQFRDYEAAKGIVRGSAESIVTASAFGEYFPNPGFDIDASTVSVGKALLVEAWGTALLMFVILALTDKRQTTIVNQEMVPFYIGFTVAVLISLYAPITQAGWNPARDFGPRLVAAMAGWGRIAIPGPRNGFWVYIVGPKLGAPLGALAYDVLINPGLGSS